MRVSKCSAPVVNTAPPVKTYTRKDLFNSAVTNEGVFKTDQFAGARYVTLGFGEHRIVIFLSDTGSLYVAGEDGGPCEGFVHLAGAEVCFEIREPK